MNSVVDILVHEDDPRYRVSSAMEVLAELRSAMAQRTLLTMSYGPDRQCALTTILEVDADGGRLILDICQNPIDNKKVMAAHTLEMEMAVHRIRVRFVSGPATLVSHNGKPALQIAIPSSIVRIQRREAYRVDMPANETVNCRFPHPVLKNREIVLRVADLSVKGMGLVADRGLWPAQPSSLIKECRVDLPSTGVVHCDAEIVRVFENPSAGKYRLWIGCQFVHLPGSAATLLQRYILELERARLARSRGLDAATG